MTNVDTNMFSPLQIAISLMKKNQWYSFKQKKILKYLRSISDTDASYLLSGLILSTECSSDE